MAYVNGQAGWPATLLDTSRGGGKVDKPLTEIIHWANTSLTSRAVWPVGGANGLRIPKIPVYMPGAYVRGGKTITFADDYYGRIHIIPATINLGNLISGQQRVVEIWNAYMTDNNLEVVGRKDVEGLGDQFAAPASFRPLQSRTYTLTASLEGPPSIAAEYSFRFYRGGTVYLRVYGNRVLVFPFRANWAEDVLERREFATDVLTTRNGKESRVSYRTMPRMSYEFGIAAVGRNFGLLDSRLVAWSSRIYCVPLWSEAQASSKEIPVTLTIDVNTVGRRFRVGGMVVLYEDETKNEAAIITEITASSVKVQRAISTRYSVGTKIMPAISARVRNNSRISQPTALLGMARVQFDCEDTVSLGAFSPKATLDGLPVLTNRANRAEDVSLEYSRMLDEIDFKSGRREVYDLPDRQNLVTQYTFHLKTLAEIVEFRAFFDTMRGRQGAFWFASGWDAITARSNMMQGTAGFTADMIGYEQFYKNKDIRNALAVYSRKAAPFYAKITGVGTNIDKGEEAYSLSLQFPVNILKEDVVSIQFLQLVRFESDSLEFSWDTADSATVVVKMRAIAQ